MIRSSKSTLKSKSDFSFQITEKVSLAEKRRSREISLEKSIEHSRQELHALEEQKRVRK